MNHHGTKTRHRGVSKGAIVHTFHNGVRHTTYLLASKQQERMEAAQAQRFEAMLNYKRIHDQLRAECIRIRNYRFNENWAFQWDRLVDAFLAYCAKEYDDGLPPQNDDVPPPDTENVFAIDAVDIFSWRRPTFLRITGEWVNETLIRYGYIGSAPLQPSLAISIRTLEAYRESHELCPQFSMATQCKALCNINGVTYPKRLPAQFKIAYDAYLEICRRAEARCDTNTPNDEAPSAGPSGLPARQRSEGPDNSDDSDTSAPIAPNERKRRASSPGGEGSDRSGIDETQHTRKHRKCASGGPSRRGQVISAEFIDADDKKLADASLSTGGDLVVGTHMTTATPAVTTVTTASASTTTIIPTPSNVTPIADLTITAAPANEI
ncbi:hypothetical protein BD779DRAFT_1676533 [Infundibulicybe gibba]|nr:hypothetical protein BD779DRAFT_1676533 [Infundibulicybe gibba]